MGWGEGRWWWAMLCSARGRGCIWAYSAHHTRPPRFPPTDPAAQGIPRRVQKGKVAATRGLAGSSLPFARAVSPAGDPSPLP